MRAVGATCYADVLAMFTADRARFDRFHDEWTARAKARVGIDPRETAARAPSPGALVASPTRARVAELHAQGHTDSEMARLIGVAASNVRVHRAKLGLAPNGPQSRNKALADAMRPFLEDGREDGDIAAVLGVPVKRIAMVRRGHFAHLPLHRYAGRTAPAGARASGPGLHVCRHRGCLWRRSERGLPHGSGRPRLCRHLNREGGLVQFVAVDTGISGDRITHFLAEKLKIRVAEAVGILTLLYAGMALHAEDGDLSGILDSQVEEWCKWHGKRGALSVILKAQLCDGQGVVRAWDRWNGAMITKAKRDRERKRSARNESGNSTERPRKFHGQSAEIPRNGAGTVPDLTVPNLTTTTTTPLFAEPPQKAEPRPNWPAAVAEAWVRHIGIIREGRVGKDLHPFVRLYPTPEDAITPLVRAVKIYDETCQRRQQKPAWADFVRGVQGFVPQNLLPPERAA